MAAGRMHGTPAQRQQRSKEQRTQQTERGGKPHPARLTNPDGKDWTVKKGKPDPKNPPKGGSDS